MGLETAKLSTGMHIKSFGVALIFVYPPNVMQVINLILMGTNFMILLYNNGIIITEIMNFVYT